MLKEVVGSTFDVWLISERKLDDAFPHSFSYNPNVCLFQNLTLNISRNFDFYTFHLSGVYKDMSVLLKKIKVKIIKNLINHFSRKA